MPIKLVLKSRVYCELSVLGEVRKQFMVLEPWSLLYEISEELVKNLVKNCPDSCTFLTDSSEMMLFICSRQTQAAGVGV